MKKTLLYGVGAFLAGVGLVYAVHTFTGSDNLTNSFVAEGNTVPSAETPLPDGTPDPDATPSGPTLATIWIPGTDDKLHPLPLAVAGGGVPDVPTALNELVRLSPQYYPKGTKILDFSKQGNHLTIDANKAFFTSSFWSQHGEKTTELALYALVNSATRVSGGESASPAETPEGTELATPENTLAPAPGTTPEASTPENTADNQDDDTKEPTVTFTIEGKEASSLTLGEYDLTSPLPAEPDLESKTPFETHEPATKPTHQAADATPEATTEPTTEPMASTAH